MAGDGIATPVAEEVVEVAPGTAAPGNGIPVIATGTIGVGDGDGTPLTITPPEAVAHSTPGAGLCNIRKSFSRFSVRSFVLWFRRFSKFKKDERFAVFMAVGMQSIGLMQ